MALTKEDIEAIKQINETWLEAEINGQIEALLELCAPDVTLIPPDSPVVTGKESVRKWLEDNQVEIKEIRISDLRIEGGGSMAYKTANFETGFILEEGESGQAGGTHVWILNKVDGDWRVRAVTWSLVNGI